MGSTPYSTIFNRLPDFEVTYSLFTAAGGGRKTPAFQRVRWSFMYEEYPGERFMIFPEIIIAVTREIYGAGIPIPTYGLAAIWLLNSDNRLLHHSRIQVGTSGFFVEGTDKVGVCEVVRIISLFSNPLQGQTNNR